MQRYEFLAGGEIGVGLAIVLCRDFGHGARRPYTLASLGRTTPESFRRDARVIGLVGIAHGLSHFFQLALPPLFPLLRAEFDASWTLLGALVGVFYAATGLVQFIAGFSVDRFGARPVLLRGHGACSPAAPCSRLRARRSAGCSRS